VLAKPTSKSAQKAPTPSIIPRNTGIQAAIQASGPPAPHRPPPAQRTQAALATTAAPTTTTVDKARWIYVRNTSLRRGKRAWTESGAGWQTQLAQEVNLNIDWNAFTRVIPAIHDPRLVLEADSLFNRRALY
jgi:hypothetical protein